MHNKEHYRTVILKDWGRKTSTTMVGSKQYSGSTTFLDIEFCRECDAFTLYDYDSSRRTDTNLGIIALYSPHETFEQISDKRKELLETI